MSRHFIWNVEMKCVISEMPKHFLFDIFSMKLFNFLFGNGSLQLEGGKVKQDLVVNEDILFWFEQNVEGWQTLFFFSFFFMLLNLFPFPPNLFLIDSSHFPPPFSTNRKCHWIKKNYLPPSKLLEHPGFEVVKPTDGKPMQEYAEQPLNIWWS